MSIMDTSLIASGSKLLSKFHYGHHPSVILWSSGPSPVKEDTNIFSGLNNLGSGQLEVTVDSGQSQLFNSFKFDAMVSESHDAEATVTSFPVSSGFIVSDHVIKQNRRLVLSAVAVNMQNSEIWSASVQGISTIAGSIFNNPIIPLIGGLAGTVASAFQTADRIQSTYDLFNSFRCSGTKLYISTILGPYTNCVVTGLRTKHDKNTSAILSIEIFLEELQVIGDELLNTAVRKAMASMTDYSEFYKIAQGLGVGVLGGAPLPGLGSLGDSPVKQLANLKGKLAKLASPLTSVKGRLL